MKLNKKIFFRIHSWIGIKLSILFFIVCFSGTLATLSHEMDWLFNPAIRVTPSEEHVEKNIIVKNIKQAYPEGTLEFWTGASAPYLCDIVYLKTKERRWYLFVNPYTGEVQGKTALTFQRFFRDLHYFLFIPFQIGHFTVLIFGFLLFISLGTALLFYKKWYRKLFELKLGKGKVVLFRSIHRLVGVWSVPFTILFSITGIWYFLERTNTASISEIANTSTPKLETPIDTTHFKNLAYTINYTKAVHIAKSHIPNLSVKDILPPLNVNTPIYLTGISDIPLVRNRANRVYIHPITYEVIKVQKAKESNTITWLNDIADPLHFGYWGGLITKIIWFFAGLGISGLVLTGIWISLKRKVKSEKQKKVQRMGTWKYVNWTVCAVMISFMYYFLIARYNVSIAVIICITFFIITLALFTWYIFDYKIKHIVHKELAGSI
ncbi:MAG: PepSY-associated TM helix domain-containing protein [Bacteroidota bacterium]